MAALDNPERNIQEIVATKNAASTMQGVKGVSIVQPDQIDRMAGDGAVHQGIAARVSPLQDADIEDVFDESRVLVLDQVTDPHNVGAILRSAAAFGVGGIIMQDRHAPPESGVLAKVACGALEVVPIIRVVNIAAALDELKQQNFWAIGLDGYAHTMLSDAPKYDKTAIVMGAEGKGLRDKVQQSCDVSVKIPMSEDMESLNVSNATAITLYEIYKSSLA